MAFHGEICDFCLFGKLYLPNPEISLTKEEITNLQQILPHLKKLERSSPSEYIGPGAHSDDNIHRKFTVFKEKEVASWLPIRKAEAEIIAPSGSIKAEIAMHLHHPTLVTDYGIDGEV